MGEGASSVRSPDASRLVDGDVAALGASRSGAVDIGGVDILAPVVARFGLGGVCSADASRPEPLSPLGGCADVLAALGRRSSVPATATSGPAAPRTMAHAVRIRTKCRPIRRAGEILTETVSFSPAARNVFADVIRATRVASNTPP